MKYFSYHPERTNIIVIGTDKKHITSTLMHYALPIPPEEDMRQLAKVSIMCALGYPATSHFFEAEIRDGVFIRVHANAFKYIKEIAEDFENLKRGDLYKFDTGRRDYGLLFLPDYIMQGLKAYAWNRHKEQVEEWMEDEQEGRPDDVKTGKYFVKSNQSITKDSDMERKSSHEIS